MCLAARLALGCGDCHACTQTNVHPRRVKMKALINSAYDGACGVSGCSEAERATVLYLAMQESDLMDETDLSKGERELSSNFCPFNMNADFLQLLDCDLACAQALGQRFETYNIPACVHYLLQGLRGEWFLADPGCGASHCEYRGSACGFMDFHRGGRTGFLNARGTDAAQGSADNIVRGCAKWCSHRDRGTHCTWCKCRGCDGTHKASRGGKALDCRGTPPMEVTCQSGRGSDDTGVRGCESWCSNADHCSWCKCRGCGPSGLPASGSLDLLLAGGQHSPDCSARDPLEPLPPGAVLLGCRSFKDAVADGVRRILSDPRLVYDGRRVCMDIQHVRRRVTDDVEE